MDGRREGRKEGGKEKERISWFGIGPKFPLSLSISLFSASAGGRRALACLL